MKNIQSFPDWATLCVVLSLLMMMWALIDIAKALSVLAGIK